MDNAGYIHRYGHGRIINKRKNKKIIQRHKYRKRGYIWNKHKNN